MNIIEPTLDLYAKDQHTGDWCNEAKSACNRNDGTMVTVICITYNHENVLADALDSIVSQQTSFKFKVLVGDDASQDNTPQIIHTYAELFPDIIVPVCREENLGGMGTRNLIDLCSRATSPFIALCEGDDYWTDPNKLQRQFEYMMNNPDLRACFHDTEIVAPPNWYFNDYYKPNKEGRRCIPSSLPDFKEDLERYDASRYIKLGAAHTSSMFFRWDYGLVIPESYYSQGSGDHSLMMMQLGKGEAGFLRGGPMSVYRRSDAGITMFDSQIQHFLRTRISWIKVLLNLRDFFIENYGGYALVEIDNRLKFETYNYLKSLIAVDDMDAIAAFLVEYPFVAKMSLSAYLTYFYDQRHMTQNYTWSGFKLLARDDDFSSQVMKLVRIELFRRKRKDLANAKKEQKASAVLEVQRRERYLKNSQIPKDNDLWVFSGFNKTAYSDNSKYLYEYVVEHHGEIRAYWLTEDQGVFDMLEAKGYPVLMMGTDKCTDVTSRAAIAVTDHFRMSDYAAEFGFNDGTKVVQLWHGVGFKENGDGKEIKNTHVKGVEYSTDILPQPGDSQETIARKAALYEQVAYKRELFEKYFMLVCPGQERVVNMARPWNIPDSALFFAGHPRNIDLYRQSPDPDCYKVMYAPTYRFDIEHERAIVDGFLSSLEATQRAMEAIDGYIEIRLHPHTWRNYRDRIDYNLAGFDRVGLNRDEDVYQTLGTYSQIITDYSSIAMDFAMLGKPTVFYCPDYDWYVENEAGFSLDFKEVIPGPFIEKWDDVLAQIAAYRENPDADLAMRREKTAFFFDESANGPDNSERIVAEIKRRLLASG